MRKIYSFLVAMLIGIASFSQNYCLCGYINGGNYGIEEESGFVGDFVFDDNGSLKTTFIEDSYVWLKTTDGNTFYKFESYVGEDRYGVLRQDASEPMFVRGGVEVTFTLTDNGGDTFILSYETAQGYNYYGYSNWQIMGNFAGGPDWKELDPSYEGDNEYIMSAVIGGGFSGVYVKSNDGDIKKADGWYSPETPEESDISFEGDIREGMEVMITLKVVAADRLYIEVKEIQRPTYGIIVSPNDYSMGEAYASENSASEGTFISLQANPYEGYHFLRWESFDCEASSGMFYMPSNNVFITAIFEANAPIIDTWTVVGEEKLVGSEWDKDDNSNNMVLNDGGEYVLVKENVYLEAGSYEYMFVFNHGWEQRVPEDLNAILEVEKSGTYTIKFCLNAISKTGRVYVCSVPEVDETFTDETTGLNFKIISVSEGSKSVELEQYAEGSPYSGDVVIPEIIIYKDEIFHVTKIAANAFAQCIGLTSIEFKSNDCENGIATNAFEGVGSESNPCNLILPESWKKEYLPVNSTKVWFGGYFKSNYVQDGIDETEMIMAVYPNPVCDDLFVQFSSDVDMKSIEILGVDGRVVKSVDCSDMNDSIVTIDMRNITSGLYAVKMTTTNNKVMVKEIVVK